MPKTLSEVGDCPIARRANWLSMGLRMGESDFAVILYQYLVAEYRGHPNKKRAIFIFDRCLERPKQLNDWAGDMEEMDLTINYSQNGADVNFQRLESNIDKCKMYRAKYLGASWFERLTTSSGENRPPSWLFDGITEYIGRGEGQGQMVATVLKGLNAGGPINSQGPYTAAKRKLPRLKRELKDVGFDTKRVGLDDMMLI
jgi:hypothetical protein